jgi:hypothetical protein
MLYKDLYNLTQNIILSLTVNLTLYKSLKLCSENIKYKRFKKEFDIFINDYEIVNYNVAKVAKNFSEKFSSYELDMFLSVLMQSEKEGNIIQNLENYLKNLDMFYYKNLKKVMLKRTTYVAISTVITLINTLLIILYPMFIQITSSINEIFK